MLQEKYSKTFVMRDRLTADDLAVIEACGLIHLLHMLSYQKNRALLITLTERWHNEHNTFHLPTGEITVTPEDVYWILQIPIVGEMDAYDVEEVGRTDALREVFDNPYIAGYSMASQDMVDSYAPLPSVSVGLIGSFLIPDRSSHGLSVGWGQVL